MLLIVAANIRDVVPLPLTQAALRLPQKTARCWTPLQQPPRGGLPAASAAAAAAAVATFTFCTSHEAGALRFIHMPQLMTVASLGQASDSILCQPK